MMLCIAVTCSLWFMCNDEAQIMSHGNQFQKAVKPVFICRHQFRHEKNNLRNLRNLRITSL